MFWLQEAQEMALFKFKSELPPPLVFPSAELSQLIKTNLHYPETYIHPFVQNRLEPCYTHIFDHFLHHIADTVKKKNE